MNDVVSEDQRNMQPALLDCQMLQPIDLLRVGEKQKRADLALEYSFVPGDALRTIAGELAHLPNLLLERHLLQKIIHEPLCLRTALAGLLRRGLQWKE